MRTGSLLKGIVTFLSTAMLCVGCASLAERGLLPDVVARRPPDVHLSPEVISLEEMQIADNSRIKSLISSDGRAHLFVIDKERKIHHVEVAGNKVLVQETLGATDGAATTAALDAVEHPAGRLRVLAGDRQFIRPAPGQRWQEIKGNLCARFVPAGDDLLCAFVAKGKETGAPARRDWTVGWFILVPVVFWSDVLADKLVLAQESENGWIIRAVLDPETKLSARPDFMVGTDRAGAFHFLYQASGGSKGFIIAFSPGGGGAWGGDTSGAEIRYARVPHDRILPGRQKAGEKGEGNVPLSWAGIQGTSLPPFPYFEDRYSTLGPVGPGRHFVLDSTAGSLGGLIWVCNRGLDDGVHRTGTSDMPWIYVRIKDSRWDPHFDIVTASDLPDPGWQWINDPGALITNDPAGNNHVLLIKTKLGFWSSTSDLCYFVKTGAGWSAPVVLESDLPLDSRRSLSVDEAGSVFAVWENRNKVVGKWILPNRD